ncbi:MAG: penicillin-binding protein 1A [Nitrospinota bacterium]
MESKATDLESRFPRLAVRVGIVVLILSFIGVILFGVVYIKYGTNLPPIDKLTNYRPNLITKVYDSSENLIAEYYIEKRILTALEDIPTLLIEATLAVEDAGFRDHNGINFIGIGRASVANLKAGKVVQGGSSITQQVSKLLLLSPERTIDRKLREVFLALKLERHFTKDAILEIYLNHIYYGHGAYGVEAAANIYFGKSITELNISEIAMMAGLPKAPNNYSPYRHVGRALQRRRHALLRMVDEKLVSYDDAMIAAQEPFILSGLKEPLNKAPWFTEHVRREVEKEFGSKALYQDGLVIKTSLNSMMQDSAKAGVISGLEANDKRLGYRETVGSVNLDGERTVIDWRLLSTDPINEIEELPYEDLSGSLILPDDIRLKKDLPEYKKLGVITKINKSNIVVNIKEGIGIIGKTDFAWATKFDVDRNASMKGRLKDPNSLFKVGDIIEVALKDEKVDEDGNYSLKLEQTPDLQGALIALENETGAILAMIGGYDSKRSKFNRATQALRQPGSSFKPIIYTAALDSTMTPATIIIDAPIIYDQALNQFSGWKPMNFEQKFYGPTTIREAVAHSRNVVTIKVLEQVGIENAIKYARLLGIEGELDENLGLALGVSPVKLVEITNVYATLANQGIRNIPYAIESITDSSGLLLRSHEPSPMSAVNSSTAFLMMNILKGVVKRGSGRGVGRVFREPIGGKTGTTDSYQDAWFIGATKHMTAGVWVGRDDNSPIGRGEAGSNVAIPIWNRFFKDAVSAYPVEDFRATSDIVFARINKKSGLLTKSDESDTIFEAFLDGTEPTEFESNETDKKKDGMLQETNL